MILELLESRRARRFAGGALTASVAVHLLATGMASRQAAPPDPGRPEPISVRFLIPPDQPGSGRAESIRYVALGPAAAGWDAGTAPAAAPAPDRGVQEVALATREPAPEPAAEDAFDPGAVFQEFEVDSAAARDPRSGGPVYPDDLRLKGVQGEVLVEFAVDTTGHADEATFNVVQSTHPDFAAAVREALPRMLFTPAVSHGRRVRQLVRLPMRFKLVGEAAREGAG